MSAATRRLITSAVRFCFAQRSWNPRSPPSPRRKSPRSRTRNNCLKSSTTPCSATTRLRLIFTCCHPALSLEAQVALTLHVICGLPTEAIARAFLVGEDTMSQRLLRAKKKIRDAGIPYETPAAPVLDERIDGVLAVLYLVFSEGYAGTSGAELISSELCREAIRLARLLDAFAAGSRPQSRACWR